MLCCLQHLVAGLQHITTIRAVIMAHCTQPELPRACDVIRELMRFNSFAAAERGSVYFCKKVLNCMKSGGIAALIYNMDMGDDCAPIRRHLGVPGCCWLLC